MAVDFLPSLVPEHFLAAGVATLNAWVLWKATARVTRSNTVNVIIVVVVVVVKVKVVVVDVVVVVSLVVESANTKRTKRRRTKLRFNTIKQRDVRNCVRLAGLFLVVSHG